MPASPSWTFQALNTLQSNAVVPFNWPLDHTTSADEPFYPGGSAQASVRCLSRDPAFAMTHPRGQGYSIANQINLDETIAYFYNDWSTACFVNVNRLSPNYGRVIGGAGQFRLNGFNFSRESADRMIGASIGNPGVLYRGTISSNTLTAVATYNSIYGLTATSYQATQRNKDVLALLVQETETRCKLVVYDFGNPDTSRAAGVVAERTFNNCRVMNSSGGMVDVSVRNITAAQISADGAFVLFNVMVPFTDSVSGISYSYGVHVCSVSSGLPLKNYANGVNDVGGGGSRISDNLAHQAVVRDYSNNDERLVILGGIVHGIYSVKLSDGTKRVEIPPTYCDNTGHVCTAADGHVLFSGFDQDDAQSRQAPVWQKLLLIRVDGSGTHAKIGQQRHTQNGVVWGYYDRMPFAICGPSGNLIIARSDRGDINNPTDAFAWLCKNIGGGGGGTAPTFGTSASLPAVTRGGNYDQTISVSGTDPITVGFKAGDARRPPSPIAWDAGQRKLLGNNVQGNTASFILEATNAHGSVEREFTIAVNESLADRLWLSVIAVKGQTLPAGVPSGYGNRDTLTAGHADGPSLVWGDKVANSDAPGSAHTSADAAYVAFNFSVAPGGAGVVPASPTDGLVGEITQTTIGISWANAATNATGVRVQYRTPAGSGSWLTATLNQSNPLAGNATTCVVQGLSAATGYDLRVTTFNAAGDCATPLVFSAVNTAAAPQPPAAPTSLVISNLVYNAARIGWTDNAADEADYLVQLSTQSGVWFDAIAVGGNPTAANAVYVDAVQLSQSTAYSVRVRAANANGPSAWLTGSFTTPAQPAPPAALTNIVVDNVTDDAARVTWTNPATNETAVYLQLESPSGSDNWVTAPGGAPNPMPPDSTQYAISGLAASTAYRVRGHTTNADGVAAWLVSSEFTTAEESSVPSLTEAWAKARSQRVTWRTPYRAWVEKERDERLYLVIDTQRRLSAGEAVSGDPSLSLRAVSGDNTPNLNVIFPVTVIAGRYIVVLIVEGEYGAQWELTCTYATTMAQTFIDRVDVRIAAAPGEL